MRGCTANAANRNHLAYYISLAGVRSCTDVVSDAYLVVAFLHYMAFALGMRQYCRGLVLHVGAEHNLKHVWRLSM